MKIEERLQYKYISSDGKEFDSELEAKKHEMTIVSENVYNNAIIMGDYMIFKIKNKDELESLFYNTRSYDDIIDTNIINNFPCFICRYNRGEYGYIYRTMEYLINMHEKIASDLRKFMEENK